MDTPGISWRGGSIDDVAMLRELPPDLVRILSDTNGFVLREGALHVRGASLSPEWHSLRSALQGPRSFRDLYEGVRATDVPFAQDQFGDQFLLRDGRVLRLSGETGEFETLAGTLAEFLRGVSEDIERFLNIGLAHRMQPGQLLLAYPPFVFREASTGVSLKAVPAADVILFHADLARQLRDVPNGARVQITITE